MLRKGFTLAEVLITLAIIGIVAAMTIPTLINNYQKQVTVTRLKKAYSQLAQAIKLSEIDNGNIANWEYPEATADSHLQWVKRYISPYLKILSSEESSHETYGTADVILTDGTTIRFWNSTGNNGPTRVHAFVYFVNPDKSVAGKTQFELYVGYSNESRYLYNNRSGVMPYDYIGNYTFTDERTVLKERPTYGCQENYEKNLCAALIMYDGWKISDDYPW